MYDILQEFVYQFQGACQYRTAARNDKDIAVLAADKEAWAVRSVHRILSDLVRVAAALKAQGAVASVKYQFGHLAMIELSRLE